MGSSRTFGEVRARDAAAPPSLSADSTIAGAAGLSRLTSSKDGPVSGTGRRRGWMLRRMLALADAVAIVTAALAAEWLTATFSGPALSSDVGEIVGLVVVVPVWLVAAKIYGLYDRDDERTDHSTTDEFASLFHLVTVGTAGVAAFCYVTGVASPSAAKLLVFWAFATLFTVLGRAAARARARTALWYLQNTVVVGAGEVGQRIAKKLLQHSEYGINLVGFVDHEPMERQDGLEHIALLGGTDDLPSIVRTYDVERVIIAFSGRSDTETLALVRSMNSLDVQVDVVPRLFELVCPGVSLHTVEGIPLVGLPQLNLSRSSRLLKRVFDVSLSALGLLALAPVLAAVAVAIKLDSRGPVFFRQTRMGANEAPFRIFKFRTMVADAEGKKDTVRHLNHHLHDDPRMFKAVDDPRVTKLGRFLRRTSLDELPQLLNVLSGEMSLVGPRPLILDEDSHVREWARHRLAIKPGITGLWQVLGRSDIPFGEMVQLDYLYVSAWSLGGDIKLLVKTIPSVLFPRTATR